MIARPDKRRPNWVRYAVMGAWVCCAQVSAQWTAIRLHQPADRVSRCLALSDQQQGGWNEPGLSHQPVIWSGSPSSEVSLAATATDQGEVTAIWQGYQAGNLNGRASVWQGSAQSRVDLDPGSVIAPYGSFILAMREAQQAGYIAAPGVIDHAAMWIGSAASFVDLHPAGANYSFAYATDGTRQGGLAQFGAFQHASLWNGSAASFVDLNPYALGESSIVGMAPGQQVGWYDGGPTVQMHAALWSGTAASLVDLHPFPGFGGSQLSATTGHVQVGGSAVPGGSFGHAGIWFGTAASFVDLHTFLPPGYGSSFASSVYQANGLIYVGGDAANLSTGLTEAYLWVGVPAPASSTVALAAALLCTGRRRR